MPSTIPSGVPASVPKVRLSSGYDMPLIGLGTSGISGDTCMRAVEHALSLGLRHIDSAQMYGERVCNRVRQLRPAAVLLTQEPMQAMSRTLAKRWVLHLRTASTGMTYLW